MTFELRQALDRAITLLETERQRRLKDASDVFGVKMVLRDTVADLIDVKHILEWSERHGTSHS